MAPSALYQRMHALASSHAKGEDLLGIRAPRAIHGWGHNHLVSRNAALQATMDNEAFARHLKNAGPYIDFHDLKIADIVVDEHQRKASVRMSYFLKATGGQEVIEQDLIWMLKFTDEGEVEGGDEAVLIKESVEFIDAATGVRLRDMVRERVGEIGEDVTGSIGITSL
jgi:hypothetical protein